jgi:hypothetical protein
LYISGLGDKKDKKKIKERRKTMQRDLDILLGKLCVWILLDAQAY